MRKILYLGLTPPLDMAHGIYTHCPIIRIVPRNPDITSIKEAYQEIQQYTHYIFTSKNSVRVFFKYLTFYKYPHEILRNKVLISVGQTTSQHLVQHGFTPTVTAANETAEGVVQELKQLNLSSAYVFWPHSALARPVLTDALKETGVKFRESALYDTLPLHPDKTPNIEHFDEIVFTSPSTVNAFLKIFGALPKDKTLTAIGPITRAHLNQN